MQRQAVISSRIKSVGHTNDVLEVEFKDGAVYQYDNVSQAEYQAFVSSSSLGSALSALDKKHTYRKV